ncbi:MAG: hypothetical protein JSV76_05795, partial [Candidatus Bathyarchaeota archaeon]
MAEGSQPEASNNHSLIVYCYRCGVKVRSDVKFCSSCGTAMNTHKQPQATRTPEGKRQRPDVLGIMSAGVILILLAVTYILYPIELTAIGN